MFGGHGVYLDGTMVAIVWKGEAYLRTDAATRADFAARGLPPFRPSARQTMEGYRLAPPELLDDGEALIALARAARAEATPAPRRGRRRSRDLAQELNLGATTAAWLAEVGVRSLRDVERRGVIEVCRAVRAAGHPITLTGVVALQGALMGLHWQRVPPEVKAQLAARWRAATSDSRRARR